ncbi:MAG: molybdenum cofactor biosynthesis protein MoaE [Verrucomicrobiota bacterium]|jgi:molybdopterin synthase catalytic subunit
MRRELTITRDKIDEAALVQRRELSGDMGAVICFLGVVRGVEEGRPIVAIDYEAFTAMARHQFVLIFDQVEKRWPVASVRLVHRVGRVAAGEPSLWVEIVAPHREEAFAACQFIIAEMKRLVPIWKKPCPA